MQSLFSTPTPYNVNTTCPDGQPGGWGTVTPNPVWLNYCAGCITPESGYVWPTFEWGENPLVTSTPTATTTPFTGDYNADTTVDMTFWYNDLIVVPPDNTTSDGVTNVPYNQSGNFFVDVNNEHEDINEFDYNLSMILIYDVSGSGRGSIYSGYYNDWWVKYTCTIYVDQCVIEFYDGENVVLSSGETYIREVGSISTEDGGSFHYNSKYNLYIYGSDNINVYDFRVRFYDEGIPPSPISGYGSVWYHEGFYDFGTIPEPTTTPVNSDYCSVVNGLTGTGPGGDDDGELPGIWVGGSSCFSWAGINTSIFGIDLFIPGIQICFQSIEFGTLDLFGVNMDMDLIAAAMAGVVLIRIVTRS